MYSVDFTQLLFASCLVRSCTETSNIGWRQWMNGRREKVAENWKQSQLRAITLPKCVSIRIGFQWISMDSGCLRLLNVAQGKLPAWSCGVGARGSALKPSPGSRTIRTSSSKVIKFCMSLPAIFSSKITLPMAHTLNLRKIRTPNTS